MLETLYSIASFLDPVLGLGSFTASAGLWAWLAIRDRRLERHISVVLLLSESREGLRLELPLRLKARDLTRAELLGRLGMLPMRQPGSRFSIRALSSLDFLEGLEKAQKSGLIEIPCTRSEIEQFDL